LHHSSILDFYYNGIPFVTQAAIAFKPRTGRAVVVVLAGEFQSARVVQRTEVPLLPPGEFAPYHAAEGLEREAANRYIKESVARAQALATLAVREASRRCKSAGLEVRGCAVLVGTAMPNWTTEQILAVHVRMHQAEGELFRDVLVKGVAACGIRLTTLPDRAAIDAAAEKMGSTKAELEAPRR
jgi:hypothetical protein